MDVVTSPRMVREGQLRGALTPQPEGKLLKSSTLASLLDAVLALS